MLNNICFDIVFFKVSDAPSAPKNKVGTKTATLSPEDKEIEAMLAQLKAWEKRHLCDDVRGVPTSFE